jgi:hypothetical protein
MAGVKGASRATYFRTRRRLEESGQLAVEEVAPIPLRRTRPPGKPTDLELEALEAGHAVDEAEDLPIPTDIPAREAFAQSVRGTAAAAPGAPMVLDDLVAWEHPGPDDDGEGE